MGSRRALVRARTARCDQGRPGRWARRSHRATAAASSSSSSNPSTTGHGPSGRDAWPGSAPSTALAALDHLGRGPVVVVEPQDGGTRQELGEAVEQRGVGPVPRVDGLARVTDDEQVAPVSEPGLEQAPLRGVHVLELVDEDVSDAPPLGRGRGSVVFEQRRAARHEIVEVEHVALASSRRRRRRRPRRRRGGTCPSTVSRPRGQRRRAVVLGTRACSPGPSGSPPARRRPAPA